jgi:hypothetical protein
MPTSVIDAVRVATKDWWYSSPRAQRATPVMAKRGHRHFHTPGELPRKALRKRRPRTKYSKTWAPFLIMKWITSTWSGLSHGKKKVSTGFTTEAVLSAENVPVDMEKMKENHSITGNQRLIGSDGALNIVAVS